MDVGLLSSALSGHPQDTACAANLQKISHQLRRSARGELLGYGIKVIGDKRFITERAWWPDLKTGERTMHKALTRRFEEDAPDDRRRVRHRQERPDRAAPFR